VARRTPPNPLVGQDNGYVTDRRRRGVPQLDHLIVPTEFSELNRGFYRARPYSYLSQRTFSLLLMIGESEQMKEAAKEEVEIDDVKIRIGAIQDDDEQILDYAALEATVLFHHAAEALFRLYFAHVGGPACPWLEASRLDMGPSFRTRVQELTDSLAEESTRSDVLMVFRGAHTWDAVRAGFSGTEEKWREQVDGLLQFLAHVGRRLLSESFLYNAAKHGIAVLSEEMGMRLGDADDPLLHADGPTVTFLDKDRGSGRWNRITTWIDVGRTIVTIMYVVGEIKALFQIARARYLNERADFLLPNVTPKFVEAIQGPEPRGNEAVFVVNTMREELRYYREPTRAGET
jgi:hypothetical protein